MESLLYVVISIYTYSRFLPGHCGIVWNLLPEKWEYTWQAVPFFLVDLWLYLGAILCGVLGSLLTAEILIGQHRWPLSERQMEVSRIFARGMFGALNPAGGILLLIFKGIHLCLSRYHVPISVQD